MKNKDTIKLFGHSMMVEYGATGETGSISVLRLDRDVRFSIQENQIQASYVNDGSAMVERFASSELARNAYHHLQAIVRRYVLLRRIKNGLSRTMIWTVAPATLLILALSLNVAATRGMQAHAAPAPPASANEAAPVLAPVVSSSLVTYSSPDRARAMADGVRAGRYSLQVSNGKSGTLYVFSDPACGYCRTLEPELAKLARSFTIHIFPVSVVGGEPSAQRLAHILCQAPTARADSWKKAISRSGPSAAGCEDGHAAVAANDEIFTALGMTGTPSIFNASGDKFPAASPNTAAAIAQWLRESQRN